MKVLKFNHNTKKYAELKDPIKGNIREFFLNIKEAGVCACCGTPIDAGGGYISESYFSSEYHPLAVCKDCRIEEAKEKAAAEKNIGELRKAAESGDRTLLWRTAYTDTIAVLTKLSERTDDVRLKDAFLTGIDACNTVIEGSIKDNETSKALVAYIKNLVQTEEDI